jgi:hypothetical protein
MILGGGYVLVINIVDAMAVRRRARQAFGQEDAVRHNLKVRRREDTGEIEVTNTFYHKTDTPKRQGSATCARQGPVVLLPFARFAPCRRHIDKDSPGWNIASKYMDGGL